MQVSAPSWHERAMAEQLDERSIDLRRRIIDVLASAKRGHVGPSMSLIEIFRVLYDDVLRYDAGNPEWKERDNCILSKGHGCLAQYVMLADKGFFPEAELAKFCSRGALLGGHPDGTKVPGVEASTGSLGHGLPIGVGFAVADKFEGHGNRTFVVLGDGECNEGSIWEAAMTASRHRLDNLVVMVDYNKFQSYGATAQVQDLEPFSDKWRSFGFAVAEVCGHCVADLRKVLDRLPLEAGKPSCIICHTVKGKGLACAENDCRWHHKGGIGDDMKQQMLEALR